MMMEFGIWEGGGDPSRVMTKVYLKGLRDSVTFSLSTIGTTLFYLLILAFKYPPHNTCHVNVTIGQRPRRTTGCLPYSKQLYSYQQILPICYVWTYPE
jgi:hypothetical protein